MKITIAEARLLKNSVAKKLHDLIRERNQIAYVDYDKGEDYTKPIRTFKEVTSDMTEVRNHYRIVKNALALSNLEVKIRWNGETITIIEALELVKQLRLEVEHLHSFSRSQQVERISNRGFDSSVVYRKALFDPMEVKKEADSMLKEANRLSILIDKANFNSEVELDFVDNYQ